MIASARVSVADVAYDTLSFDETARWIVDRASRGKGGTVCTPNADYVVRARRDLAFRAALAQCDLCVPDGMGVIYAARVAGRPLRRTVTGRLLLPAVAEQAAAGGWPIALIGAGPGIAQRAAERLCETWPTLVVSEAISPPAPFVLGSPADNDSVRRLRAARPRVVFVGLGAPKQELWIVQHRRDLPDAVIVGVGAALDVVAGRVLEAPRWMTAVGLEWLLRLLQEPRRLARRYLIDDPWIFVWAIRARLEEYHR